VTAALTSESVLFCPPKLLIGAYYPVRGFYPRHLAPPGVERVDSYWRNAATAEQLHAFVRWMGEKAVPTKGDFFISGAIPEAYYAFSAQSGVAPVGELVFVSKRTVEILTPFEVP
jgi:hypothetical protein